MIRSRLARAVAAATLLAAAPAAASAQGTVSAACVGGAIGCSQVDFFFTQTTGGPVDVDNFLITLTAPGFLFGPSASAYVEAQDAFGFNFADPTVNAAQTQLSGIFTLFAATLNPTLRIRTEFSVFDPDIGALGATLVARDANGGTVVSGTITARPGVTAIPEPGTVVLVATGLLGMAAAARRRRVG